MVAANNIKFDPNKQKLVKCESCPREIVVGKFAKNNQKCQDCKNFRKNKAGKNKLEIKKVEKTANVEVKKFGAKLEEICLKLGFSITEKRSWKKRYPLNGEGIATIYIMPEQSILGMEPRVEYFSLVIQRAIGVNENLRKLLPINAASDCEVIASELGTIPPVPPQLGQEKCDVCGNYTDEFAVDEKKGKILCIKPNNCFKKKYSSIGAGSVQ